jgi:hypothetical protein
MGSAGHTHNHLCEPEGPQWDLAVDSAFGSCSACFSISWPTLAEQGYKKQASLVKRDERQAGQARPLAIQQHPGRKGSLLGVLLCQSDLFKVRIYGFHF